MSPLPEFQHLNIQPLANPGTGHNTPVAISAY